MGLTGLDWNHLYQLGIAFLLASLIGLEREIKLKSAGLRTHALVGLGAALIMLVSKWGFFDVVGRDHVSLDPSRVAANIVSGIGFIGAGLIFVRKDIVHGLTTAATIWLTAGIGMACGGGLISLALTATLGHFVIVFGYTKIMRAIFGSHTLLQVRYKPGRGVAAEVISLCTAYGFTVRSFTMKDEYNDPEKAVMYVQVAGTKPLANLIERLVTVPNIISVNSKASRDDD
ncbi:MAG: MgtC/SapB family protein [Planctomycetes bacterium]|nr:MgtC/SapB family protein [Planctomycetota bacterium]